MHDARNLFGLLLIDGWFVRVPLQVLAGELSARMGKTVENLRFDDSDKLTAGMMIQLSTIGSKRTSL